MAAIVRAALFFLLAALVTPTALAKGEQKTFFDIAAQPVAAAINVYSEQAHMLFLYQTELVQSVQANAVRGHYSVTEALDRLLCGTGLTYELTAPDTVALTPGAGRACPPSPADAKAARSAANEARSRGTAGTGQAATEGCCTPPSGLLDIEGVTVTARRRSERLQDYAGTAAVFREHALDRARVDGLEDIVNRVSNAYFEERPGSTMNIFIRGAGTATNGSATQTDAAVGLYVDGIYSYLQGSRIPLVFYDMDRVEVFKGPQGSLYGRNAVGGAVAAYTARPTRQLESYLSLQRAEFDWTTAEGRLNVPLGESLAVRFSGYFDERDSYYSNVDPNRGERGEEVKSGRVRLRYQPGDTLDVVLGYERLDEDGGPQILVPQAFGERLRSVSDTDDFARRDSHRFLALVEAQLAPQIELSVISGYISIDSLQTTDSNNLLLDARRGPFTSEAAVARDGYQLTQDVIVSSLGAEPFQWLVGVSYFKDSQDTASRTLSGFPSALLDSMADGETGTEMAAGFIDLSYRLTAKLQVQGSLRYSDEARNGRRSDSLVADPNTGLPFPAGAFRFQNDYSRLSPGGTISYAWTEDLMTYARVATAYQSGGINTRPQTIASAVFGPSTAISYEAGAKTSWLGRRLLFNLNVFRMQQDDYQYQVDNPPFNDFQNVGEARTDGLEVELIARLSDWLTIPLSFGYLDARLTRLISPRAGTTQGQPLFGIPKRTGTAGIDIDLPLAWLGDGTRFYLHADYAFADERFLGASPIQLDDYETLDFKSGVRFADRYELYVFGENALDDLHVITPALGLSRILSSPRHFGIGVSMALN